MKKTLAHFRAYIFLLVVTLILPLTATAQTNDDTNARSGKQKALPQLAVCSPISIIGKSCYVGLFGRTNIIAYRPLPSQAFDAHLFNQDGTEISKSSYGDKFGLPIKPDPTLLDGSWQNTLEAEYGHPRLLDFTGGDGSTHEWDFNVLKDFRVNEPGEYRLQVQVRLFTKDTNGVFQPFMLPPVETNITVSASDLGK